MMSVVKQQMTLQLFYLIILNYKRNDLETSVAIKIATALQSISTLIELDLSSNSIGTGAVDDIATALTLSPKLVKFHIHNNDLDTCSVANLTTKKLARYFLSNRVSYFKQQC